MNRKLLFLFFLLMPLNVLMAQKIQVKSFGLVSNDLTANVYPRFDLIGNPCALVKIVLNDKLAAVEGNVIGDIVNKGTENWVYVSEGTKELKVLPKTFLSQTIRFADYGFSFLEGKKVYLLELVGDNNGLLETTQTFRQSNASQKNPIKYGLTKTKTIRGVVYNERENGEPIIGAAIYYKKGGLYTGKGHTFSDLDGKFTIEVPAGTLTLFVSYLHLKKQSIKLYDDMDDNVIIYMK